MMRLLIAGLLLTIIGITGVSCSIAYKNTKVAGDNLTTEIGLVGMTDDNSIPGGMLPLWRHSRPIKPPEQAK